MPRLMCMIDRQPESEIPDASEIVPGSRATRKLGSSSRLIITHRGKPASDHFRVADDSSSTLRFFATGKWALERDCSRVRQATCSIAHICPIPGLLMRFVPASHMRPPSIHVPAILFVVCPEFAAQSWLLIKEHEQMYAEGNRYPCCNRGWVGAPESHPQPNPPCCEAHVHGVPQIAVETHDDQSLRRSDRSGCAASCPSEVPDTAQGNGESKHRRKRSQPSQIGRARRFNAETQPRR